MSADAAPQLELWQFRYAMYPEKARWALDYKRIPHVRRSVLPGPHVAQLLPRFRYKSTPILVSDGQVVKGSANVIDYLEQQFPEPALYPTDPAQRTRALELQTWFDDAGGHVRRAYFRDFLLAGGYAADILSTGYPALVRRIYRAAFPATQMIMKLDMMITDRGADEGLRRTQEALDIVVKNRGPSGYLVGDRFSVADLTAATVLAAVAFPPEYPVSFPQPLPAALERWLARWSGHPGVEWVREMYRRHRGHSVAAEDRNG
ncbi:MAG TPA: glutathione S-transferase family protein [Nevskiales bacterium]|nr:glutathione S-transferase family protein [Nevskiales bacterium]